MNNKKLLKNKIGKGLVSLITIIVLLSSILATTFIYENNITANVIKELPITESITQSIYIQIKEVNDIKELSQLNEGWYEINNGYVYYLDTFNSYVPLYIKVKNPEEHNGILGVEKDGTIIFYKDFNLLPEKEVVEEKEAINENQITGKVITPNPSIPTTATHRYADGTYYYCEEGKAYCHPVDENGKINSNIDTDWAGMSPVNREPQFNEELTKKYQKTLEEEIRPFGGNPAQWGYTDDLEKAVCISQQGCYLSFGLEGYKKFEYGEGFPLSGMTGKSFEEKEKILNERNKKLEFQQKSRAFFAEAERILTEFQGLGYYSTLFFSDDELLKWRDSVDRIFATLYLGTEYWSSEICGQYLDGQSEGIAYAETPQGLAQVGAHIEATRTQAIKTNNATVFIYKITFAVRNGDFENDPRAPEEMNINVLIKGQQTIKLFKKDQKVKRGSIFGKTGRNAIVQESGTLFDKVCITFDQIPFRWKLDNKELCNKIQESTGIPITIEVPPPSGTTRPEDDINDF